MKDLRRLSGRESRFPRVVLCHQGSVEEGDAFFHKRWPEVPAIADPGLLLYSAFGLGRGSLGQVAGPRAILATARAFAKGNLVGKPSGDVMVMPGAFLIAEGSVLWNHDYRHSGENPDWMTAARSAGGRKGT